ncbi:MAG: SoxR reducing system RseC family protein [bacterium]
MSIEEGIITKIEGPYAFVKVVRGSACAHCPSAGSCHIESDRLMLVKAVNTIQAGTGQRVKLFLPSGSILAASFLLYLVPLFGLLFGAITGKLLLAPLLPYISSELIAGGFGFIAMAAVFLGIRIYDRRQRERQKYIPEVIQIV